MASVTVRLANKIVKFDTDMADVIETIIDLKDTQFQVIIDSASDALVANRNGMYPEITDAGNSILSQVKQTKAVLESVIAILKSDDKKEGVINTIKNLKGNLNIIHNCAQYMVTNKAEADTIRNCGKAITTKVREIREELGTGI